MAVQDGPTFKRYAANGVTTFFAIPFLLLDAGDLVVTLNDAPVTSGFTLTGVGSPSSTATFSVAPAGDLLFRLVVPFQRLFDYQENGDFLAKTVNADFDRIWQALKELRRVDSRSLKISDLEPEGLPDLPSVEDRIGKLLSFDAFGNPVAIAADSQSATELTLDLANDTDPAKGPSLIGYSPGNTLRQVIEGILVGKSATVFSLAAYNIIGDETDETAELQAVAALFTHVIRLPSALAAIAVTH